MLHIYKRLLIYEFDIYSFVEMFIYFPFLISLVKYLIQLCMELIFISAVLTEKMKFVITLIICGNQQCFRPYFWRKIGHISTTTRP